MPTTTEFEQRPDLTIMPPSSRTSQYLLPGIWLTISFLVLPKVLLNVLRTRPMDIFFYSRWADDFFRQVWLLDSAEAPKLEEKRRVAAGCEGVVIEVGPAFGSSLEDYDKNKVSHIFLVEPNLTMHDILRENIEKTGWEGRSTIVACGIEEDDLLLKAGVPEEGVDCVMCVYVGFLDVINWGSIANSSTGSL